MCKKLYKRVNEIKIVRQAITNERTELLCKILEIKTKLNHSKNPVLTDLGIFDSGRYLTFLVRK